MKGNVRKRFNRGLQNTCFEVLETNPLNVLGDRYDRLNLALTPGGVRHLHAALNADVQSINSSDI
jgi:hypothetical protein